MATYLITGGAGFIGSSVTEKILKQGNKAIVIDNFCDFYDPKIKENNIANFIDNTSFKLYKKDIRDKQALKEIFEQNQIDIVIHLAAMAGVRKPFALSRSKLYGDPKSARRNEGA